MEVLLLRASNLMCITLNCLQVRLPYNMLDLFFHLCVLDNNGQCTVKVEDFPVHVNLLMAKKNSKISEEFETIAVDASFTHHAARLSFNRPKNRYKNLIPCKFHLL